MTPIQEKVNRLNALFIEIAEYKADHPDECIGYYDDNIGSLLNAYREGDLRWDAAIAAIRKACQPTGSDSQRLDWLQSHRHAIESPSETGAAWYIYWDWHSGLEDCQESYVSPRLRDCIDAAMEAEPSQPVAAGEAKECGDNE